MWKLAQTASETNSRPSELLCIEDKLAAYQLDCAVTTFRVSIENALLERIEVGMGKDKKSIPKYTLKEILEGRKIDNAGGEGDLSLLMGGPNYDEVG